MRRLVITLAALSIAGISLALWIWWERGLDPVERGKHLVRVVGCNDCHTPTIKGPGGLPIPDTSRPFPATRRVHPTRRGRPQICASAISGQPRAPCERYGLAPGG